MQSSCGAIKRLRFSCGLYLYETDLFRVSNYVSLFGFDLFWEMFDVAYFLTECRRHKHSVKA